VRKSSNSEWGLLLPRLMLAFFLCSAGVLLTVLSFAAPSETKQNADVTKIAPWVLERTADGE
jgi:hypothetical protein